ncbi:Queuine tRNA-ribosyltransferase subunit qtrtd1 [Mortierella polycephala]|uniref:Queuine tRNA-ribosyltransferase accessory subunit 2 n=1 Tax=Mortierella polycephala TaxID=41804 RepID=A0A9P6PZQ5_9FUNG|nr:Queuine tRNA-ribosyltransferase subunit qtrtd1 [Mortierella polycephala]
MAPLNFDIHQAPKEINSTARLGTLSIPGSQPTDQHDTLGNKDAKKRVIETPGCFMYSIKGSVPHLTPDNMRLQDFGGVNVSLEQLLQNDQPASFASKWPKFTLADYLHLQDLILLCDLRDYVSPNPAEKLGPNTDRHVLLSTPKGIRQLTLNDYLQVVRQFRPDIVVAMADNVSLEKVKEQQQQRKTEKQSEAGQEAHAPGEKRIKKSIERTLKWLDQILLEREGKDGLAEDRKMEEEKRRKKEKKEKKRTLDSESTANADKRQQLEAIQPAMQTITTEPWSDVAVFAHVQGALLEQERIRSAVETSARQGVDGFIIDAASVLAIKNATTTATETSSLETKEEVLRLVKVSLDHLPLQKPRMVYGIQTPEDVLKAIALGVDLFDTSYPYQLTEDGKASLYSFGDNVDAIPADINSKNDNRWINLWDEEHADKFVPILVGCECYACKGGRHTRAYINHLLRTHEMLATVLLISHNMYQYSKFFFNVRKSIQEGTFEKHSQAFHARFGVEPVRTGEKHEAQLVVEAALQKRNQRLEGPEGGVAPAIVLGEGQDKQEANGKKRPEVEGKEEAEEIEKKEKKAKKELQDNSADH